MRFRLPDFSDFKIRRLRSSALRSLSLLPAEHRAFVLEKLLNRPVVVDTPRGRLKFLNLGRGSCKRARTLMTKEPDSLKWIDSMEPGSVFWDIGANVGVLTLYAALRGDLQVWAFEPAAVNFYNLAANCEFNSFSGEVRCLQLGFSNRNEIADIHVSQLMAAHSFTFREKKFPNPKTKRIKSFPALQAAQVWSIDDFVAHFRVPLPNYVKIDVPGLTLEILEGAQRTLGDPTLRELQIEVKEHGPGGKRVRSLLDPHGYEIVRRNMKHDGKVQGDLVFGRPTTMETTGRGKLEAAA